VSQRQFPRTVLNKHVFGCHQFDGNQIFGSMKISSAARKKFTDISFVTELNKPRNRKSFFTSAIVNTSKAINSSNMIPQMSSEPVTRPFTAKTLQIQETTKPKVKQAHNELVFGKTFTDHMLVCEWEAGEGWKNPSIVPYGPLSLDPSCSVFHYAIECFEGMKAYKDPEGKVLLFRPEANMKRLAKSASRLLLPTFDQDQVLECIKQLVRVDESWIPDKKGYSLYIRPSMIGTGQALGVGPSSKAMLFVIMSPVGPYWKEGFNAVSLLATSNFSRAWPGGVGDCKLGGNYAPCIRPQVEAQRLGHAQNLWLMGDQHYLTEVGTMNLFLILRTQNRDIELVTPPLDGMILPGVTRDSILQLARQWGEFTVSERSITMGEVIEAHAQNRILEVFGAGTACVVTPVRNIHYEGADYPIPLDPNDTTSQAGPLTKRFESAMMAIQFGEVPHEWSVAI